VTLNLKIEILKVFTLELSFNNDQKLKKKELSGEEKSDNTTPAPTK
jgi:hypothetical protein